MQNILSWLDWQRSSKQKKQEELKRLQTLVNYIFEQFFGPLMKDYAANKPLSEEVVKKQKEPLDLFNKSIVEGLKTKCSTADESLQASLHTKRYQGHKRCELFMKQLEDLFSFKYDPKSNPRKVPNILVTFDMKIIAVIAYALQETAICIPKVLYSGTEQVPDDVKDRLTAILVYMNTIRLCYKLQATFLNLNEAENRLSKTIDDVDGYLHFPLKRLPTASLTQEDLKNFYVTRHIDIDILASSIIRNDGVILIAGYRGVGKSTFINAVLEKLHEKQDSEQLRIVPVTINVAKIAGDAGPLNVLRLCIRALYDAFLGTETSYFHKDLDKLLDKFDKHLLGWAHLRASYKVDISQGESVSSLRNLEVSLDLKPGDLIPKPISGDILGNLLPGLSGRYSKEWKKQVEQTIALLDYDADRAEEDIISIIEQFYSPGRQRKVRIKLAFIFDEMDKLDLEEVETLIKQLKNLFLTRNAVFLLVTGKEVYYKRLQGRKDEDSPFSSYFSRIVTIPLFNSNETSTLLEKLWFKEHDNLSARENTFIQTLAGYLNYHARGVPREIIRELQDLQTLNKWTYQSYVTDSSNLSHQFQVYAELQNVIEGVVRDVSNKQWQEQIERGLYVLIEEFLDQKKVELDIEEFLNQKNASSEQQPFQVIRKNNFKFVPAKDLRKVIELLKGRLPGVTITDANNPDVKKTLFSLTSDPTQGNVLVITVDDLFYKLTGRSTSTSSLELEGKEENLPFDGIINFLEQQQTRSLWKRAFSALRWKQSHGEAFNSATYNKLYHIFTGVTIPVEYADFRPLAAQYLTSDAFFKPAMHEIPQQFIDMETNEELLRSFIQLVQQGGIQENTQDSIQENIDEQAKRRNYGKDMLLSLLNRHKSALASKNSSQQLPKSILTDLISALSLVTDEDILEQVVASLDVQQDVSDLIPALQRLEHNSRRRLIDVLLVLDFQAISQTTLLSILSIEISQDINRLNDIWSSAIKQKQKILARQVMSAILHQWCSSNTGQEAIYHWVGDTDSNASVDKPILSEAVMQNRIYFSSLLKYTPTYSSEGVANRFESRLKEVLKETEPPPPPVKPEPQGLADTLRGIPFGRRSPTPTESLLLGDEAIQETRQSAQSRVLRGWLITLAMLAILAVYFAVPFDLPANPTLVHQLMARFLEVIYVYAGVIGILLLLIGIIVDTDRWITIGVGVGLLVIAGVCFFIQIKFFPLVFTLWGQVILIALLGAFWLPLLALRLPLQSEGASS